MTEPDPFPPPRDPMPRVLLLGVVVALSGFGALAGWAATARLDSAVHAPATLVVDNRRKTISLLDSGLLRALLVREGEHVVAGQQLLQLDDAQARAALGQAQARLIGALVRADRLAAEVADAVAISLSPEVEQARGAPALQRMIAAEQAVFSARVDSHNGAVAVLRSRMAQFAQQVAAHRAGAEARETRLRLVRQELAGVLELQARGFAPRTRVLELQRTEAQLDGELGELRARAFEAEQAMAQAELEILALRATRRNEIARELQDVVAQIAEGRERLASAVDLLERMVVRAPEGGIVTDLRFVTPGSSVLAGQPVLDLVPQGREILIEASVSVADIEQLAIGQNATVRLVGLPHRLVPPLPAAVTYVGADRQMNARNEPFFVVRVALAPEAAAILPAGLALAPGMPADVLISRQPRSALDYILSPLMDASRRAMREQ